MGKGIYALVAIIRTEGKVNRMSDDLISREALMEGRVENDPVRIAAMCAETAFNKENVLEDLEALAEMESRNMNDEAAMAYTHAIGIVEKGGIE